MGEIDLLPFLLDKVDNSKKLVPCNVLYSKIDQSGYDTSEKSNKECKSPFPEYVLQNLSS